MQWLTTQILQPDCLKQAGCVAQVSSLTSLGLRFPSRKWFVTRNMLVNLHYVRVQGSWRATPVPTRVP